MKKEICISIRVSDKKLISQFDAIAKKYLLVKNKVLVEALEEWLKKHHADDL